MEMRITESVTGKPHFELPACLTWQFADFQEALEEGREEIDRLTTQVHKLPKNPDTTKNEYRARSLDDLNPVRWNQLVQYSVSSECQTVSG